MTLHGGPPYRSSHWQSSRLLWTFETLSQQLGAPDTWPTAETFNTLHAVEAARAGVPALSFVSQVKDGSAFQGRRARSIVLGELYDGRIAERHEVPTRSENWHDLFNALSFIAWPRAKHALHARQYRCLTERIVPNMQKLPGARTREQDALTLFDEGGVVIACTPTLAATLRALPVEAFTPAVEEACAAGNAEVAFFGHALFEHMAFGIHCPGGCSRVIEVADLNVPRDVLRAQLDAALAAKLRNANTFCEPSQSRRLYLDQIIAVGAHRGDPRNAIA